MGLHLVEVALQVTGVLQLALQLLDAPLEAAHLLLQDAQLPAQLQPCLSLLAQLCLVAASQVTLINPAACWLPNGFVYTVQCM